jgi:hypothetical protein
VWVKWCDHLRRAQNAKIWMHPSVTLYSHCVSYCNVSHYSLPSSLVLIVHWKREFFHSKPYFLASLHPTFELPRFLLVSHTLVNKFNLLQIIWCVLSEVFRFLLNDSVGTRIYLTALFMLLCASHAFAVGIFQWWCLTTNILNCRPMSDSSLLWSCQTLNKSSQEPV